MDAVTACYHFAGPHDPTRFTLRDLWLLYVGRQKEIRQHVVWQSIVLFNDKIDVRDFLRCGSTSSVDRGPLITDPELKRKVDEESAKMIEAKRAAEARHVAAAQVASGVTAGERRTCPQCGGAKIILRGRSRLACRACNGSGKVSG
jgi:hypothetical protein